MKNLSLPRMTRALFAVSALFTAALPGASDPIAPAAGGAPVIQKDATAGGAPVIQKDAATGGAPPEWALLTEDGALVQEAVNRDGIVGIRCHFLAEGERAFVYARLRDNDFYLRAFSGIEELNVKRVWEGGEDLEFVIAVLLMRFRYVVSRKYDDAAFRMDWTKVSGDFEYVSGGWAVEESPYPGKRLVIYESFVVPLKGIDSRFFLSAFKSQAKASLDRVQALLAELAARAGRSP